MKISILNLKYGEEKNVNLIRFCVSREYLLVIRYIFDLKFMLTCTFIGVTGTMLCYINVKLKQLVFKRICKLSARNFSVLSRFVIQASLWAGLIVSEYEN